MNHPRRFPPQYASGRELELLADRLDDQADTIRHLMDRVTQLEREAWGEPMTNQEIAERLTELRRLTPDARVWQNRPVGDGPPPPAGGPS